MTRSDSDFALWAAEQAAQSLAGPANIDRDNIAEALEAFVRALHRELQRCLARHI